MKFSCLLLSTSVALAGAQDMAFTQALQACMTTSGLTQVYTRPECSGFTMGGVSPTVTDAAIDSMCASSCLPVLKTAMTVYGTCVSAAVKTLVPADATAQMRAVYESMATSMEGVMGQQLDYLCTKNLATGGYCVRESLEFANAMTTAAGAGTAGSGLTAMCPLFQSMGCCVGSMFAGYPAVSSSAIASACGWTALPAACPAPGVKVSVTSLKLQFAAITMTAFNALSADAKNALLLGFAQDFAAAGGFDASLVSALAEAGTDGGLVLKIIVANGGATAAVQKAAGNTEWTKMLAAYAQDGTLQAKEVQAPQAVQIEGSGSTAGAAGQVSAAGAIAPAFFTAAFAAAFALL